MVYFYITVSPCFSPFCGLKDFCIGTPHRVPGSEKQYTIPMYQKNPVHNIYFFNSLIHFCAGTQVQYLINIKDEFQRNGDRGKCRGKCRVGRCGLRVDVDRQCSRKTTCYVIIIIFLFLEINMFLLERSTPPLSLKSSVNVK